ncbi:MAG: hypothetical protein ACTHN5_06735 [Phycisphaerae bacterium]
MAEKHEHHEDEVKLQREGRMSGQAEAETPAPQKQEWPEEAGGEGKKTGKSREGGALKNDSAMQGRVAAEERAESEPRGERGAVREDRMKEVGSREAKEARGIDAHEADPGRVGGPMDGSGRQAVEAPGRKMDRVSEYEGDLKKPK